MATHWSEVVAKEAINLFGNNLVIASGISLSGTVHIGHSREFLTAAIVAHSAERLGAKVKFIAFADDMDPLRKVYPFLNPDIYQKWVGCSLNRIPDPYGCHSSYSEHFLEELLVGFKGLGITPELIKSSDMYLSGKFADLVRFTISRKEEINSIFDRVSGTGRGGNVRKKADSPHIQPECPDCYSIQATKFLSIDGYNITFYCSSCEKEFVGDLRSGSGKLVWRCDWPMRWSYLGVQVEPFGHDHNSSGGSFETGVVLAREVYSISSPIPVPYGWIHNKSGGAMHSSAGNSVSVTDLTKAFPPEIIWWMLLRRDPLVTIPFDPVTSIIDETRNLRELSISNPESNLLKLLKGILPVRASILNYSWEHIVLVTQLAGFDHTKTLDIIRRSDTNKDATVGLTKEDVENVRNWLNLYAPGYRVSIRDSSLNVEFNRDLDEAVSNLVSEFLVISWTAENIHSTVHKIEKDLGIPKGSLFSEIYLRVLGVSRGPRLGFLLESIEMEKVISLIS